MQAGEVGVETVLRDLLATVPGDGGTVKNGPQYIIDQLVKKYPEVTTAFVIQPYIFLT